MLRYFLAVAEYGTASEAADVLQVSQPSLSRQMKKLEHDLGLQLFARSGTRNVLTSEGREFLNAARDVVAKEAEAAQLAGILAAGALPKVSLAAPRTTLIDVVAPFVATFRSTDPVPAVSEISITPELSRILPEHDMVVTSRGDRSPGRDPAESLPLACLPVWCYVPGHHRWAGRDHLEISELAEETLIFPSSDFAARQILDSALRLEHLTPRGEVETNHGRVAQALAAAGRGAAVVSDDRHFGLSPVRLCFRGEPLTVNLTAVWRKGHHAGSTLHSLALRLQEFCTQRYGPTLPDPAPARKH